MDEDVKQLLLGFQAQIAALTEKAEKRPPQTMSGLLSRWADAHSRLPSFACDHARGLFVLAWAPADGPYAGIKLGDRDPNTLSPEDVDLYRSWRYGTTTRRKGPPTTATVNREVMMLKRPLNFAVSRNTISRSPLHGLDDEDEDNVREVVIEEEGFSLICEAFGEDQRMRALTTLGYDSGMRKTELILSRLSWMDPARGYVHIPGAVAKNGQKRVTDLSLRAWKEIQALPRHIGTDLIFANPDTADPYGGRWIHQLFVDAVAASGVTGRDGRAPRLHDLRRSFVTLMRRRGVAESVIMAKSGHKDHKVFKRYSIVGDEDLRASWLTMEEGRQRELAALRESRRGPHGSMFSGSPEHTLSAKKESP